MKATKHARCRYSLKRLVLGSAAAALTAATTWADEPRALAKIAQPAPARQVSVASPEWAVATLSAVDSTTAAARSQAVTVLGATSWQSDAHYENILIRALRQDPMEVVRIQAANVLRDSRFLTPLTHSALQHSRIGSARDNFPGERAPAVKWAAGLALQKHPTSADPSYITRLQIETAKNRPAGSVSLAAPVGRDSAPKALAAPTDGAEESEGFFSRLPRLGRPVPTDVPIETIVESTPNAPCPCANGGAPVAPDTSKSAGSLFNRRPAVTASPAPVVIAPSTRPASSPAYAPPVATPPPVVKGQSPYASVQPVSSPGNLPPATPIPTTDRQPPEKASSLPEIPADTSNMSLSERRSELREMGLQDSTLKLFAEQVGAPPPTPPGTSESPGLFRRMFGGSRPAPQPIEQTPRSSEGLGVLPISNTPPLRTP